MHKLRENAEKELKAIEEKGLTSSNLDNAYKPLHSTMYLFLLTREAAEAALKESLHSTMYLFLR